MKHLLTRLDRVEKMANAGKIARFLAGAFRYLKATGFNHFVYPITHKGLPAFAQTFYHKQMEVLLPAGTDIYLTGGKTHASEIRLARYLIQTLQPGDSFVDVGAHFGYFTLLASALVGEGGRVFAIEAARGTFKVLAQNIQHSQNVRGYNQAVSDEEGHIIFYEFPVRFSEYNAINAQQYQEESWYARFQPIEYQVQTVVLDTLLYREGVLPRMVKIDVEGGEYQALRGMLETLRRPDAPIVVMEYLPVRQVDGPHQQAEKLLRAQGFSSFRIDSDGCLQSVPNIAEYFSAHQVDSDNIVFVKSRL